MICGIDPGLSGGIAFIEEDTVCSVEAVPVHKIKEGKSVKRYLDCFTILHLLHTLIHTACVHRKTTSDAKAGCIIYIPNWFRVWAVHRHVDSW